MEDRECYVIDNNGFIIISPYRQEIGKFFGEINGGIMLRLVEEKVFKQVVVYDYQAVCFESSGDMNASNSLLSVSELQLFYLKLNYLICYNDDNFPSPQPLFHVLRALKWLLHTALWYIVQFTNTAIAEFIDPYIDEDMSDYPASTKTTDWLRLVTLHRTRLKSCDMQRVLYLMYNEKDNVAFNMTAHVCERPFVVLPIPNSNMILLVIDQRCPRDPSIQLSVNPADIHYPLDKNQTFACYKNDREFSRVRPVSCINRHINVSGVCKRQLYK